jgi:hypothetical protein
LAHFVKQQPSRVTESELQVAREALHLSVQVFSVLRVPEKITNTESNFTRMQKNVIKASACAQMQQHTVGREAVHQIQQRVWQLREERKFEFEIS